MREITPACEGPNQGWQGYDQCARLRALARRQIQMALRLRDQAAEMRLRLCLERLRQLHGGSELDRLLQVTLEAAIVVTGTQMGNLQLFNRHFRGLEIKAHRGFKPDFLDYFEFVADRDTACGMALNAGRQILVSNVAESPIFTEGAREVMLKAQVRAVHSTPLIDGHGQVLGIVSVHYALPFRYGDGDGVRLGILARCAADLIGPLRHRGGKRRGQHYPMRNGTILGLKRA